MKQWILLLAAAMILAAVAGCGASDNATAQEENAFKHPPSKDQVKGPPPGAMGPPPGYKVEPKSMNIGGQAPPPGAGGPPPGATPGGR